MVDRVAFTQYGEFDFKDITSHFDNATIYRLTLKDDSLAVSTLVKTRGINGGYFYKKITTRLYNVHTNSHGEKYLRVMEITGRGKLLTVTPHSLRSKQLIQPSSLPFCEEMMTAINNHLFKILGFSLEGYDSDSTDRISKDSPVFLCYPFMRDKKNRKFVVSLIHEITKRKRTLHYNGERGLTKALRESKSIEDFVKIICYKSAVKTKEDVQDIIQFPEYLQVFTAFDLSMGASEAVRSGYASLFSKFHEYANNVEMTSVNFLLKYLPKNRRSEVLELVSRMSEFRREQEKQSLAFQGRTLASVIQAQSSRSGINPLNSHSESMRQALHSLPVRDRHSFTVMFWEEFKNAYALTETSWRQVKTVTDSFERRNDIYSSEDELFTKAMFAYMKAYSKKYLQPAPSVSEEQCIKTGMDLFGIDLREYDNLVSEIFTVEDLNVQLDCLDLRKVSWSDEKEGYINLLSLLENRKSLTKSEWDKMTQHPVSNIFHSYDNSPLSRLKVPFFVLEDTLRRCADKIDRELVKINIIPSPETRIIYLLAPLESVRYKINWRYYLLGVPVRDVPLYKKAKIRSKKDILFWVENYNSLPLEMYKELLDDEAGVTKLTFTGVINAEMAAF